YDSYSYEHFLSRFRGIMIATRQIADELAAIIPPETCTGFLSKTKLGEQTVLSEELFLFDERHLIHVDYYLELSPESHKNNAKMSIFRWSNFRSVHVELTDFRSVSFQTISITLMTDFGQAVTISNSHHNFNQPPEVVKQFYVDLRRFLLTL
ncbi:MAG: hypothetical protein K6T81_09580, partial [Alicyclobacillus macrosporangiidus]|uniref:hypothetical protein n=1 Tax=Alicyclobacillus macrosporangiidus TaxID=392015 RepID=UPI0026F2846C